MKPLYLLLGSNLGNREEFLDKAKNLLSFKIGKLIAVSSIYETAPWGNLDQPAFLNQVVLVQSNEHPDTLIRVCKNIEKAMGRETIERWGPRIIDIDILYYADMVYQSDVLTIPHASLHERKFTLLPLAEIAENFVHPVFNKTTAELLLACEDSSEVAKLAANSM